MKSPLAALLIASAALAHAADPVPLGAFDSRLAGWAYNGGWEFKGAKGRVTYEAGEGREAPGSARLAGDFQAGGAYVALTLNGDFPKPRELRFWVKTGGGVRSLQLRLADGGGQFFQYEAPLADSADWQEVVLNLDAAAAKSHWAGANDGAWHDGLSKVWICLTRQGCAPNLSASLLVDDVTIVPAG